MFTFHPIFISLLISALSLSACQETSQGAGTLGGYVEGEALYLAAPGSGQLQTLTVERGDLAHDGQTLFTLDNTREQAALAEATARLEQAKAQAIDLNIAQRSSELSVVQASREQAATANIQAVEAGVTQARWQLEQKTVHAPGDAQVLDTFYHQGEWVPAGSPVVSLLPPENRKIRFFIPEPQLGGLQTGQQVQVNCDGCGAAIPMTISYISPQAEYTPPVIYSKDSRAKLVVMVEAVPSPADALKLKVGQPVDVVPPSSLAGKN